MNRRFDLGLAALLAGTSFLTANKAMLVDLTATDTAIKAITDATNASPIVITSGSHGFANGDIVVISGITGNLAANGTWRIANVAGNTFELMTLRASDALASTGSGAYSAGGVAVNLGTIATNLDDLSAARVSGSTDATLTNPATTVGDLLADPIAFDPFTGTAGAIIAYAEVGAESADIPLLWIDGKVQVVCAANAASSATTLYCEPLSAALSDNTVLTFSNGATAQLNGAAAAGARSLTVDSLAAGINAGHQAEAYQTNPGFPFVSAGSGLTATFTGNKLVDTVS